MKPRTCECGAVFTPGGGRQVSCDPCRGARRLAVATATAARRKGTALCLPRRCFCGASFAPRGRQQRCDACLAAAKAALPVPGRRGKPRVNVPPGTAFPAGGAPAAKAGPQFKPREITWAAPPLPVPEAEALRQARADLDSLRKGAEALLRRHAQDVTPYGKGIQAAALTLLNAAGFSRHPTERRYAGREELAGLEAAGELARLEAAE